MTVRPSTARTTLPQLGTHAAFPGLCELPDGYLLHVWRDGPGHLGGTDGRIVGQHLDRTLRSWGDPFVIADWDRDLRGPSVMLLADGRIALAMFTYATPSAPACATWVGYSDDKGLTFDGWEQVSAGAPLLAVSGPVVELPDGTQLLSAYGRLTANTYPDGAFCFRRPPGAAWSAATVTAIAYDGQRDYQEPWMIRLRSGALLAAYRWGNRDSIAMCASHDGGLSWTAPTLKFPGWGQATLLELSTGPTVVIYRRTGAYPNPAVYRQSDNRGGTWGPEIALQSAGSQMSYAALVETGPGLVAGTLGIEDSGSASHLVGFHMLDVTA